MTDLLYLEDSNVRTFDATVERILEDGRVVLDRTHFYPEGGGQPADTGTLRVDADGATLEWPVADVQKRDTVYHALDLEAGPDSTAASITDALEPGTTVTGELDWDRRDAHMRYHTAQHLLSAYLLEAYDAPTTGNQLYADRARLDCAYDRFQDDDLAAIEAAINDLIDDDLAVRWYELERDVAETDLDLERTRIDLLPASITEIRIVEIGDENDPLDRVACAGTHVQSTADLGTLEITGRETAGSGEERVRFRLLE
ncbi:alanyl-tRNA editing protein [Natronosalvus caseinilyticus]|uniref:alanyl-tRNA editing protein n=1 Tax=Natronosalvus caseinilyticus TaxID=2953747 RepID=UPI0028AE7AD8|nr:alanyl-tRNA editing protein [Natronosalvus caseinilyticus]